MRFTGFAIQQNTCKEASRGYNGGIIKIYLYMMQRSCKLYLMNKNMGLKNLIDYEAIVGFLMIYDWGQSGDWNPLQKWKDIRSSK